MPELRNNLLGLGIRIIIAVPFFMAWWVMVAGASGGFASIFRLILGFSLLIAAAFIIAPGFARLLGLWAGSLYYPRRHSQQAAPLYSKVEAYVKQERFKEAANLLDEIAEENPDVSEPYIRLIEIALKYMEDSEYAEEIYVRGVAALECKEELRKLNAMYREMNVWVIQKKEAEIRNSIDRVDI